MNLYLKLVDYEEIKTILEYKLPGNKVHKIIHDSEHVSDRNRLIKNFTRDRTDVFVLCTYKIECLRWAIFYYLFCYFNGRKRSYVLDASGYFCRITIGFLFLNIIKTFIGIFIQLLFVLIYRIFLIKQEKTISLNKNIDRMLYLRATDNFNLKGGGSLGHTIGLVKGFSDLDVDVSYFGIDKLNGLDVKKELVHAPSKLFNLFPIFERFIYSLSLYSIARKHIANGKFDVIYQRYSRDNITGVLLKHFFGLPLILEFNSFLAWDLEGANHGVHRLFGKATSNIEMVNLNSADLIVTVSQSLKQQLLHKGIDDQKILVCSNGVDPNKFCQKECDKELRDSVDLSEVELVIGFVGTFGFWHGIGDIIEAVEESDFGEKKIGFLFVGDGQLREQAKQRLKDKPFTVFTGMVPYNDVNHYLSICDIVLCPSVPDRSGNFIGSPTKLFEYMACEKVIIGSDIGQLSEIISPAIRLPKVNASEIKGDEVGILVNHSEPGELLSAMQFAVEHKKLLHQIGTNARKKVVDNYTWKHIARPIVNK